jgi:transcription initiation factor TFIIF subunit alpha
LFLLLFILDADRIAKSDSEDTETETLKEEQLKKEAEEKNSATGDKSKVPSNSSTKGTNTPSNRPNHPSDSLHKAASSATLKRPGSPNLSEASGNESSRNKKQKKNATSSSLNTGTATPNGPPSRPRSPTLPPTSSTDTTRPQIPRKPSKITNLPVLNPEGGNKRPRGAGSGTDGEGAGSSGETSDGARKKKKKIKGGSNLGTPHESRAGSPAPNGGRAASPGMRFIFLYLLCILLSHIANFFCSSV